MVPIQMMKSILSRKAEIMDGRLFRACNLANEQIFCGANNVMQPIITWTPIIAPSGTGIIIPVIIFHNEKFNIVDYIKRYATQTIKV